MKIFSSAHEFSKTARAEILNELRAISERQGAGLRRDSFLSLTNDREDQFFLKSSLNYIFWGKVFFEPFTLEKAGQLKKEQEILGLKFSQPLKLQVFFSEGGIDPAHLQHYPKADYFRYAMIHSAEEKGMIIDRVLFSQKTEPFSPPAPAESGKRLESGMARQSQLTRNELADLIDLSLDLKRG